MTQPGTEYFQPFLVLSKLDAWPRPGDLESINTALDHDSHALPLVVGPSGSGKTVLLHRLLTDQLNSRNISYEYIDEYAGFRDRLASILHDHKTAYHQHQHPNPKKHATKPIIILDQFEQYLGQLRQMQPGRRERERAWFKDLVAIGRNEAQCRFLISIRNEWYFDLGWLGDIIPAPVNCISIEGPKVDAEDDVTRIAVAARFGKVLNDDSITESVLTTLGRGSSGHLLLLETQIVGAVLEREKLLGRKIGPSYVNETLGGIEGAIDKYFEGILQGAPDRRVALKVLCALSVRTYFRRQEDMTDLLDRLFEDAENIREALNYLVEQRLVITRPTARYELAHDYLAQYFHQKSGSELDPTDRDNILYHFESDSPETSNFVLLKAENLEPHRGTFSLAVIIPLILLMTVRLVNFGLPWLSSRNQIFQELLWDGRFFDVAYLPIYVAHLSWAIYVALLYKRLFSPLNESGIGRLFSRVTVVNMTACVIVAMFFPYVWLASIGWGGIVVGLKLFSISQVKEINSAARARFNLFGGITIFNCMFLTVLGIIVAFGSFRYVTSDSSRNLWIYVSCVFSLVVTYACAVLASAHVQRKGVSQLLGLLARMHTSPAPSFVLQ